MWILYGLIGALGKGFTNLFRKKISDSIKTDIYLWLTITLSIPILSILLLLSKESPLELIRNKPIHIVMNSAFWIAALVFNIRALKKEELSYISPLSAFIPIFTLALGWGLLQENPPTVGLIGIAVVFIGAYVTNLKSDQVSWYEPILHLAKNSGARYGMAVSVCFAIIGITTKSITNDGYSPFAWMWVMNVSSWILLAHVPIRKSGQIRKTMSKHKTLMISVTVTTLIGGIFGVFSIASTEFTAYALSVRRFDILFSILLGWKVLGESNIRNKIIGGSLMTAGVVLVAIL